MLCSMTLRGNPCTRQNKTRIGGKQRIAYGLKKTE
jgi:hypothetical protein